MSQADQNIANDTGSNVRADINSNLSALFSIVQAQPLPQ